MEFIDLPSSSLRVSRIAFGAEPLGGTDWGPVDERSARDAVARAMDLGITLFDTADVYGLGRSEQLLSDAMGARRHDMVIMTKVGVRWSESSGSRAATTRDLSPTYVVGALEASLRRLRLDCIPLYILHWPDLTTPLAETLAALRRCQEAGKLLAVGLSNFTPESVVEAHQQMPLAAVQAQYNLVNRSVENALLPTCRRLGIPLMAYGPLAQGLLTGKFTQSTEFDTTDRRHRLPQFQAEERHRGLAWADRARAIGQRHGRSPTQVALNWLLRQSGVGCVIAGARTPAQVEENASAASWHLPTQDVAALARSVPACSHHS